MPAAQRHGRFQATPIRPTKPQHVAQEDTVVCGQLGLAGVDELGGGATGRNGAANWLPGERV